LPGAAYRVNDRLSVGATLGVAVSHAELEGPYFLQSPGNFQGTPLILDLQSTGAALTWSAGMQYQLTPQTTLGVAYQSENDFNMDGNAVTTVPNLGRSRFDTRLDLTWPRSLGVGLRHQFCPHRIVAVDVLWYDWSSAFDNLGLLLLNPDNIDFANLVGPRLEEQLPLRWKDTVSVRVGAERQLPWGHVLRLGYVHHSNPIPDSTLTPYIHTTLENTFSVGYGWKGCRWDTDLAYQYGMGPRNSVGTSGLVGGDFSQSTQRTDVHLVYWNWIRRW
jgi:long-subunit fatty acid transport protein